MSKTRINWPNVDCEPLDNFVADNHCHLDMIIDYIDDINNDISQKNKKIDEDAKTLLKGQMPKSKTDLLEIKTIEQIVDDCVSVGVKHLVHSVCELSGLEKAKTISNIENVFIACAIHPNEAVLHEKIVEDSPDGLSTDFLPIHEVSLDDAIAKIYNFARDNSSVIAIGETGLDQYRSGEKGLQAQIKSLNAHIDIAQELELPVQIHSRETNELIYEILKNRNPKVGIVFHSYSGDAQLAEKLCEMGYYLSFSGPLTYKNSALLQESFLAANINNVLVETDAPFLTPEPFRSCPNTSRTIPLIVKKMAEIKGVTISEMSENLWNNHKTLYNL